MKKLSILAVSVSLALAGCGSDSDSSSSSEVESGSQPKTFTVFDGYIENALVSVCETEALINCEEIGNTDVNGDIDIPSDKVGFIKAEVIAGVSKDSDSTGFVTSGYTMAGDVDTPVVNPFTTIATLDPTISLDTLAAEIGVSTEALASDYIESNDSGTHLLARTVTKKLAENSSTTEIVAVAKAAQGKIEELENEGADLSEVDLTVDVAEDGTVTVEEAEFVSDARSFLERTVDGKPLQLYLTSLDLHYKSEGSSPTTFSNGSMTEGDEVFTYTIEENSLTVAEENFTTHFFYISPELALSVADSDNLNELYAHTTSALDAGPGKWEDSAWLDGFTTYFIADDSDTPDADAVMAKFEFGAENVVISEVGVEETQTLPYSLVDGGILIDFPESDNDLHLYPLVSDGTVDIWFDAVKESYSVQVSEEGLATSILAGWVGQDVVGQTMPLQGTWVIDPQSNNENEVLMFNFLSNGQYVHTEFDVERAGNEVSGMEWGTYEIDGGILNVSGIYDQNGETGLSDFYGGEGLQFSLRQDGKWVIKTPDDVENTTFVKAESNGLYGTWGNKNLTVDDEDIMLFTFFPDGSYIHNEVYQDSLDESGAEWGTISIDPETNRATVSIIEDRNGSSGLTDFEAGDDGQEIYFEVSGDTLTLTVTEFQDGELVTESFELYRQ